MRASQIKSFLVERGVDISGCFDRQGLVELFDQRRDHLLSWRPTVFALFFNRATPKHEPVAHVSRAQGCD